MKNKIHLTLNNFKDTEVKTSQWNIEGEPECIGVKFGDKEYIIVLASPPYYEEWSLDDNGELFELERTIV